MIDNVSSLLVLSMGLLYSDHDLLLVRNVDMDSLHYNLAYWMMRACHWNEADWFCTRFLTGKFDYRTYLPGEWDFVWVSFFSLIWSELVSNTSSSTLSALQCCRAFIGGWSSPSPSLQRMWIMYLLQGWAADCRGQTSHNYTSHSFHIICR